jgi:hypothetical protein
MKQVVILRRICNEYENEKEYNKLHDRINVVLSDLTKQNAHVIKYKVSELSGASFAHLCIIEYDVVNYISTIPRYNSNYDTN